MTRHYGVRKKAQTPVPSTNGPLSPQQTERAAGVARKCNKRLIRMPFFYKKCTQFVFIFFFRPARTVREASRRVRPEQRRSLGCRGGDAAACDRDTSPRPRPWLRVAATTTNASATAAAGGGDVGPGGGKGTRSAASGRRPRAIEKHCRLRQSLRMRLLHRAMRDGTPPRKAARSREAPSRPANVRLRAHAS